MSEEIITKICTKCKQAKPLSEFYKDLLSKDKHRTQCKLCLNKVNSIYLLTANGYHIRRQILKRYRQSTKGKVTQKRYQQSEKGRRIYRDAAVRHHRKYPAKADARHAVGEAIKKGKLPAPEKAYCICGEKAQFYHHNKGYEEKHWLDVIALCHSCHVQVHHK